ncbi:MAG: class I SAM-dependent methyltransferase [Proteobacteria bacterium]|nr:class I SAM-dependent methyltransferase [Pseudomonadota bacterium]
MSTRIIDSAGDTLGPVGDRMDRMYRLQRHVYDLTRKFYLFGRDRLLSEVAATARGPVLEIGCGTARNLIRLAALRPDLPLYGIDASSQMLSTAAVALRRAGVDGRVKIAHCLAEDVDPKATFDLDRPFEAVMISYVLSMIPEWPAALERAFSILKPGGTLHIVDFGDQSTLPAPARRAIQAWLGLFGVVPRVELCAGMRLLAGRSGGRLSQSRILNGYAERFTLQT